MEAKKILVVGDVMLDTYISGTSNRLSPEAPVPVVLVNKEFSVLGGAANVANNLCAVGAAVALFGFVGKDASAATVSEMLKERSVGDFLFESDVPTIVKTRVVSRNQQIVRIDREQKFDAPDEAISNLSNCLEKENFEYIIVSDYAKGLCSPALMRFLLETVVRKNSKVLIDPKGTNWEKYRGAFLVKPNVKELEEVFNQSIENTDVAIEYFGKKAIETFGFEHLLVTRAEKGMTLFTPQGVTHIQSKAQDVYDVSGAGDTVIAILTFALTSGKSLLEAAQLANKAAGVVVSKFGTTTVSRDEIF